MVVTYRMAIAAGILLGCVVGILWMVFSSQAVPAVVWGLILIGVFAALTLGEEIDRAPERDRRSK